MARPNSVQNLQVGLGVLLPHLVEDVEDLLGQSLADQGDEAVLLQHLARDVELEVRRVDDAADEAEILRQQVLALLHDLDALDVELQPRLRGDVIEVVRRGRRDEEQGLVLDPPLGLVLDRLQRLGPVVGDVLVELLVLVLGDLGGGPRPDRLHRVEDLLLERHLGLLAGLLLLGEILDLRVLLGREDDRVADEVRVAADDAADHPAVGEVVHAVVFVLGLQVEGDRGAAAGLLGLFDGVGAVAGGLPAGGGRLAGPAGHQLDALGGHERGVEADAELADQLRDRLLRLPLLQALGELAGAGLGDRPDVGDHLVAAHADAVVPDGQGARVAVRLQADLERLVAGEKLRLRQRLEAEPVEGIGRVRDQLAEKDLLVRVQRMDHQVEELLGLGLKLQGLDGSGCHEHVLLILESGPSPERGARGRLGITPSNARAGLGNSPAPEF